MSLVRRLISRKRPVAWMVTLGLLLGAFAPVLSAWAAAHAGPGQTICSAAGHARPGAGPATDGAPGSQHCAWCVLHTPAGPPPAAAAALPPAAPQPLPVAVLRSQPPGAALAPYAAPRGPPGAA